MCHTCSMCHSPVRKPKEKSVLILQQRSHQETSLSRMRYQSGYLPSASVSLSSRFTKSIASDRSSNCCSFFPGKVMRKVAGKSKPNRTPSTALSRFFTSPNATLFLDTAEVKSGKMYTFFPLYMSAFWLDLRKISSHTCV